MTTGGRPPLLDALCALARQAGAAVMAIYAGEHDIVFKEDHSPLTAADRASHDTIVAGLAGLEAGLPILSEEGRTIPYAERQGWSRFWLVDPLDGTKEFIKRNGEFTVNIALVERGAPVAGVVYAPALELLYCGWAGHGAYLWRGRDSCTPIRVRPADHAAGLTVVMSRSHPAPELDGFLKGIRVAEALPVGSSLKLCAVAEGKADLYPRLGPTMEWDTAAGQAVVEAAGGQVVNLEGAPLRYNKENLLNPFFVVKGG